MKVAAYIIHLKRSANRLTSVNRIKTACPVPASVEHAVDGSLLSASDITRISAASLHFPEYPFPLQRAEIGAFQSHRLCWEQILDEQLDAGLIFEDDAELADGFHEQFNFALDHICELGYIAFQIRPFHGKAIVAAASDRNEKTTILEPCVVPHGAVAQMVSPHAAEKLLAATERIDRPVDSLLQLRNVTGQRIFLMDQLGVTHKSVEAKTSTIHSGRTQMPWIEREIKRFVYRWKLRRVSTQYWNSVISPD